MKNSLIFIGMLCLVIIWWKRENATPKRKLAQLSKTMNLVKQNTQGKAIAKPLLSETLKFNVQNVNA